MPQQAVVVSSAFGEGGAGAFFSQGLLGQANLKKPFCAGAWSQRAMDLKAHCPSSS